MPTTRTIEDIDQCRTLWQQMIPGESLFDLWEVRSCFHREYGYRPCFVVVEDNASCKALLPLSYIEDHGYFGVFPGETYHGLTWLEQNRVVAGTQDDFHRLMDHCPQPAHLRYLRPSDYQPEESARIDETGYLFHPVDYQYEFEQYQGSFSGKNRKRLRNELSVYSSREVTYRYDHREDLEYVFSLNLQSFGSDSYFADKRFLSSFRNLMQLLDDRGWRRITAVVIDGQVAAVDVGAVYRGVYTVLAGGTDRSFPGVAKLINFHHLEWSCSQRLRQVDFLCGDFGWKSRFHLTPRPLYQIGGLPVSTACAESQVELLKNGL